jgi:uncharacterized protein (DUF302 family)
MQENIVAGLDLPQKILVTENVDGSVDVSYNGAEYLKTRHGLKNSKVLSKIENALSEIIENVAFTKPILNKENTVSLNEGIIIKESDSDFETTYNGLKYNIRNINKLSITSELDHTENALSVGLKLSKAKLIIFSNPELGTPLMQKSQYMGIDLPLKILVFEQDGKVKIAYNEIQYLMDRHNVDGESEIKIKINNTMNNIIKESI